MKAAVVQQFERPLVIEDRPIPEPGPGQITVRMEASGLCHTDITPAAATGRSSPSRRSSRVTRASGWCTRSVRASPGCMPGGQRRAELLLRDDPHAPMITCTGAPAQGRRSLRRLTVAPWRAAGGAQVCSGTIVIEPFGHSCTQIPQPLQ